MTRDVAALERDAQRAHAIKALLYKPLLGRSDDAFTAVAIHHRWLQNWFAVTCGWPLHVDARHGFARLKKVTLAGDTSRPATRREGSPARPFTRRGYTVLCLLAAALGEHGRPRISLRDIAVRVTDASVSAKVAVFTPATKTPERRVLIDAIRLLEGFGILRELDRHGDDYVGEPDTNVLYQIDERRLALLIAAPIPPSTCDAWQAILADDGLDLDGDERPAGSSSALRRAMRRLLDDAVCHLDELGPHERAALTAQRGQVSQWLTEAGFELERRAECWIAVDTDASGSTRILPRDTIPANAAMLLLDHIAASPAHPFIPRDRVSAVIEDLMAEHPRWAKSWRENKKPALLAEQALAILLNLGLVRLSGGDIDARPAAARWRVRLEADSNPAPADGAAPSGQEPLFQEDQP